MIEALLEAEMQGKSDISNAVCLLFTTHRKMKQFC